MKYVPASVMILLMAVSMVWAQTAETGKEVRILSDSLLIMDRSGVVHFERHDRDQINGANLNCHHLDVLTNEEDPSIVLSGTATGHVVMEHGGDRVEAGEARFDLESSTVDLKGSPRLLRDRTTISAERIVYLISEGTATFHGPVKAVFPGADAEK